MSRCRASCVASEVLVGRAIDLLVPWLAAMILLAPNAATGSLEAARTNFSPAKTPVGPENWRHTRRTMSSPEQQQLPPLPGS